MPSTNFYFGRLNFKHQLTSLSNYDAEMDRADRIRSTIREYVNSSEVVYSEVGSDEKWIFGAIIEREGMLFGKFGKIYTNQPTRYDFDEGDFIDSEEEETEADYSMFLVYPEKNLIVFNQRRRIGYRQFQHAFASGYNNYYNLDDGLAVTLLKDAGNVEDLLEETEVQTVEFDLVPTNPTSDPDMQVLDNHIRNMEADNFGIDAKADGGINMDDDLMQAALSMSNAGYGDFQMEYERDNRRERFVSADKPASHETDRPSILQDLVAHASDLVERAQDLLDVNGDDQ